MTTDTEARLPYTDIRYVCVRCASCGAETTVDIANERQRRVWEENKAFKCSICDTDFGGIVKEAIAFLRLGVLAAKKAGASLVIRLPRDRGDGPAAAS